MPPAPWAIKDNGSGEEIKDIFATPPSAYFTRKTTLDKIGPTALNSPGGQNHELRCSHLRPDTRGPETCPFQG
jgi:hypothetical protein